MSVLVFTFKNALIFMIVLFSDEATFPNIGCVKRKIDLQNRWLLTIWREVVGEKVEDPYFLNGYLIGEMFFVFSTNDLPIRILNLLPNMQAQM